MWKERFFQVLKIKDLRYKILFVLGVFVVFRVMANIPLPAFDTAKLSQFFANNQILGLLNIFTGGSFDSLSIAMLGLGPYITATIVMQLLTMIFPVLERLYKEEGEQGRRKFNQYGRVLTVPFAALQGYGFITLLVRQGIMDSPTLLQYVVALCTIGAGTIMLMWLGELISEKGIGNGVSLLIFAGIMSGLPAGVQQLLITWDISRLPATLAFVAMSILIIAGVVFVTEARRNIPVSYAKRIRGNKMYGGVSTYLPLSVNPAGVIPIIFALSILLFPGMLANFFLQAGGVWGGIARGIERFLADPWLYSIAYFILVWVFTYFYTAVTFDPKTISSNMQKMGGFIPGVRPGASTASYLMFVLNRLLLVGALFLGVIAVLPSLIQGVTGVTTLQFLIGGTSLLIVVNVVLETMRQLRAQLQMRDYERF